MKVFRFVVLMFAVTAIGFAQQEKGGSSLDRGIAIWLQNNQEEALSFFRQAVVEEPNNPDAYAWLAEALRRSGSMDTAVAMAYRTLALSPCNPQAHTTLADLYNPQYSDWPRTSSDSTWTHNLKAVECDPGEGIAWFSLWIEGMRTGNREIEGRSLRNLSSSGFITPGALAYARWMLGSLPKNAILLTGGDMDTYPLVTLQESESFRTDVAVVNSSLLNMNWYAALMISRHTIVGGYTAEEIGQLRESVKGDETISVGRQVIERWVEGRATGALKRPLAIAVGVNWTELVSRIDRFTLAGPYWIYDTGRKHKPYDGATLWTSLRSLKPIDFAGLFVNLRDRSPIRRAYAPPTAGGAVTGDLWHAVEAMRELGIDDSRKLEEWIRKFDIETGGASAD